MADLAPILPAPAVPLVPLPESPLVEACKRDRIKLILAISSTAYMILFTVCLFFKGLPVDEASKDALMLLAGAAITQVKEVYGYVFGSSQGSQDKTAALAAATIPNLGPGHNPGQLPLTKLLTT